MLNYQRVFHTRNGDWKNHQGFFFTTYDSWDDPSRRQRSPNHDVPPRISPDRTDLNPAFNGQSQVYTLHMWCVICIYIYIHVLTYVIHDIINHIYIYTHILFIYIYTVIMCIFTHIHTYQFCYDYHIKNIGTFAASSAPVASPQPRQWVLRYDKIV